MDASSDGDKDVQASIPVTSTDLTANLEDEINKTISTTVSVGQNPIAIERINALKNVLCKVPKVLKLLASEKTRAEQTVNDLKAETSILRNELDQVKAFIEMNTNKQCNNQNAKSNVLVNQKNNILDSQPNLNKNSFDLLNANDAISPDFNGPANSENEVPAPPKVNLNTDTSYLVRPRNRKRPAINQNIIETERRTPRQPAVTQSPTKQKPKNLKQSKIFSHFSNSIVNQGSQTSSQNLNANTVPQKTGAKTNSQQSQGTSGTCINTDKIVNNTNNPNNADQSEQKKKNVSPPPFRISEVDNIKSIISLIDAIPEKGENFKFSLKSLNNNVVKVFPENQETWEKCGKTFQEANLQFVTYENKITRPIKVVVRGLHQSTPVEEIIDDLKDKGFKAIGASNVKIVEWIEIQQPQPNQQAQVDPSQQVYQKQFKKKLIGLPIFHILFENTQDVEEIFSIKSILHTRIVVEPLKKGDDVVPQCLRCQAYGHTRKYCFRAPRCVRCAGDHFSDKCELGKFTKDPLCVNCGEKHPANYRGCAVAKAIQKQRRKPIEKDGKDKKNNREEIKTQAPPPKPNTGRGYAQAVNGANNGRNSHNTNPESLDQNMYLALILSKLDQQSQEISWLKEKIQKLEHGKRR
ncbi:unnamed protein product [Bemisia tabaci]|uniref:Pre-C2HC domain-containing protein n=1 Tax=Bemisia tabaci TaxID=7038 RepID=A0A9P0AEN9_BEMTA|nr:unnamed protein product [Bemisia tabaci]